MSQADTIVGLGARTDHVATVPNADPVRLRLSPDECMLFACVGRVAQIQEVLERSGLPEPKAIAVLLALRAKGAIAPAKVQKAAPVPEANAALLEEVELEPDRKKEILEVERRVESVNLFEVLGVPAGTPPDDVKRAFYELSRRFHPDRFFQKDLGSYRARVERIFRRMSEAHQVLTDAGRRKAYLEAHPEWRAPPPPPPAPGAAAAPPPPPPRPRTAEDERRDAERRARFARHPYLAKNARVAELVTGGKSHLAEGNFAQAYTDLHLAAQMDEKSTELQELLTDARRKHEWARSEQEMRRAEAAESAGDAAAALTAFKLAAGMDGRNHRAAYRAARILFGMGQITPEARSLAQKAVDSDGRNADYRALLGTILLELGNKDLAKKQFAEALKLDPDNERAKKALKKLRWPF